MATGHSQAQVSRALAGHTSPRSKTFQDVCSYVLRRPPAELRASVAGNPELIDALAAVWDGTAEHSMALACIIRSLATLNRRI